MSSKEHQMQLNALAKRLEEDGIEITHIDIDGRPECFEGKYRNLPTPHEMSGHVPDMLGRKDNLVHIGESKIDIYGDSNMDSQLKVFSNRVMRDTNKDLPLHIVIPEHLKPDLNKKLLELRLSDKINSGLIKIWTYNS